MFHEAFLTFDWIFNSFQTLYLFSTLRSLCLLFFCLWFLLNLATSHMWNHLYRSDQRLTLKKKSYFWTFALFYQMLSQRRRLNVISKNAIFFLIIDFFLSLIWQAFIFYFLKLLRLYFFEISSVWFFWLFSFFCHCF